LVGILMRGLTGRAHSIALGRIPIRVSGMSMRGPQEMSKLIKRVAGIIGLRKGYCQSYSLV